MVLTFLRSILAKLTNGPLPNQWSSERGRPPRVPLLTKPSPDQPSADDVFVSADGTEAVVKLALPDFPLKGENQQGVSEIPSSAILHFKISPNGRHLMLNDRYMALTVRNPSIPPTLEAAQISSEVRMDDLLSVYEQTGKPSISPSRTLSLDYEFDMGNRDDPSIRYYRYHPEFRFNVIGAGSGFGMHTKNNILLNAASQKTVQINMKERNDLNSHHPERNYTILGVKFPPRPQNYIAPEPKDARICGFLSWRCADISDPPYYKRVWRFQFDDDGRIGSLRRTVIRGWAFVRPFVLFVGCPAWCVLLAWKALRMFGRRRRAESGQTLVPSPSKKKQGAVS